MAAGVVVDQDATGQHRLTITLEGLAEDVRSEAEEIAAALQRAGVQIITEGERTATARWCDHLVAAATAICCCAPACRRSISRSTGRCCRRMCATPARGSSMWRLG
jgi:hypothetical protein